MMPFPTNAALPAHARKLPGKKQRQFKHIWKSTYEACMAGANPDSGLCESKAFQTASGVAIKDKGKAQHSMGKKAMRARMAELETKLAAFTAPPVATTELVVEEATQDTQAEFSEPVVADLAEFDFGPDKDDTSLVRVEAGEDVVYRRGKIFASGDYPDKGFSLSNKELKKVAKDFGSPIDLDSEHDRSIFDGHLGKLMSVEASKDGSELHGLVAIPKWLDPILMEAGGKVSAAFDRATKKLVGLALTISPRVSDAILMAAFSVDQVAQGQASLESLIEMAQKDDSKTSKKDKIKTKLLKKLAKDKEADTDTVKTAKHSKRSGYDGMVAKGGYLSQSGGARDAPKGSSTWNGTGMVEPDADDIGNLPGKGHIQMATTMSGRGMMQAVHDTTASRGAVCKIEPQAATKIGPYGIVRYASSVEMSVIQGIHDTTLQNGASCVSSMYGQQDVPGGAPWTWQYPGVTSEGRNDMPGSAKAPHFVGNEEGSDKAMKAFAKFMNSLGDVDPRYTDKPKDAPVADFADLRRRDEENARLVEENRQMRMERILERATAFADSVIQTGHAVPSEREAIVTVHAQADHDDTFSTKATFSNGMSRVSAYEASILARPDNLLQTEALDPGIRAGLIKLSNMNVTPTTTGEAVKMSDERKRHLTNLDPVLKNAYTAIQKNGSNH